MSAPLAPHEATARPAVAERARRAVAVAAAAVAALATWTVVHLIGGDDPTVTSAGYSQPVGPTAVAAASVAAGLAGWVLLAGLERFAKRPRRAWTVTAIAALLVSLLGPLGGVDTASRLSLLALHLVVGAVLILALGRSARRVRR